MNQAFSLAGKTAVVTGGAQNFGKEIAAALIAAGARVVITSRILEKAENTARELSPDTVGMSLELNSEESIVNFFLEFKERFEAMDILVNNAGGHSPTACGLLEKETLQGWNDFINSNLTGTFLMLREYAKLMMPLQRGCIINIASMAGLVGRDRRIYGNDMTPNPIAYSAAKAGVIGLSRDTAAYLGPCGIRCNAISPGGFERNQPRHFIDDYSDLTMLRRMGQPGNLGNTVVFLASDAAEYITGQNLVVDGGFTEIK